MLIKQYGGSSLGNLKTYSGALNQLKNTWGDVLEVIGKPLNDVLIPRFKQLKADLTSMTPSFRRFGETLGDIVQILSRIFQGFGGKKFGGDFVKSFGESLTFAALLAEDFFKYLRGEKSWLGKKLGGVGGFTGLFSRAVIGITKSLVELLFRDVIPGVFEWFTDKIQEILVKSIDLIYWKLKNLNIPILNFGMDALQSIFKRIDFGGGNTSSSNDK